MLRRVAGGENDYAAGPGDLRRHLRDRLPRQHGPSSTRHLRRDRHTPWPMGPSGPALWNRLTATCRLIKAVRAAPARTLPPMPEADMRDDTPSHHPAQCPRRRYKSRTSTGDGRSRPGCWIEVHAENYMGWWAPTANCACRRFALSVHGVGLSIGGEGPSTRHLRLKTLCDRTQPASFSEHLAGRPMGWSISTTSSPCPIPKKR